jgi:hypothetical protein
VKTRNLKILKNRMMNVSNDDDDDYNDQNENEYLQTELDALITRRDISKLRIPVNTEIINNALRTGGGSNTEVFAAALLSDAITESDEAEVDAEATLFNDPVNYQDAMSRPDADEWKEAMKEEWHALLENNTFQVFKEELIPGEDMTTMRIVDLDEFTPIELPPGIKPIDSKWIFRMKRNPDGSTRYKARLVIRGFQQIKGRDYDETYAPVSKLSTFRMLMAYAAQHKWKVEHLDVVTAFLNPKIDKENIYMTLPAGMDWIDPRLAEVETVRLKKALYGLKQAPRLWHEEINTFLLSIGFTQSSTDPNLYMQTGTLLLLYVDDMLIAETDASTQASMVKNQLKDKFKMKDLGKVRRFLGIEVDEDYNICQKDYITQILQRFRLQKARPALSPMDPDVRLDNPHCEDKPANRRLYQSMVGSLMYASLGTRPDLAYCVTTLSRYNAAPLMMHLTAAKRALRYLSATKDLKLCFTHQAGVADLNDTSLLGFTDSDWAGNLTNRKSVGGCLFSIGQAAPIHWISKTQTVVALSTLEAEYIACSSATREAIWLRRLASDITTKDSEPTQIGCDNQGALKVLDSGVIQAKTKHIDVKYHHTKDEIEKGTVAFYYVQSTENPADILTKPLGPAKHKYLTHKLHLE